MKYKEWQDEVKALQDRQQAAKQEISQQQQVYNAVLEEYREAVLQGVDIKSLEKQLEAEKVKLENLGRKNETLLTATIEKATKTNRKLQDLGREVIQENTELLKDHQKQAEEKEAQLEEIKAEFIKAVSELGEINRAGNRIGHQMAEIKKILNGVNTVHAIKINVIEPRREGSIYFDNRLLERTFKGV